MISGGEGDGQGRERQISRDQSRQQQIARVLEVGVEAILILSPLEAVLGVGDVKSFEVQFSKKSLICIIVGFAENRLGAPTLIETAFDQSIPPEERESCLRGARRFK